MGGHQYSLVEPETLLPATAAAQKDDGSPGPLLRCAVTGTAAFALAMTQPDSSELPSLTVVGPAAPR